MRKRIKTLKNENTKRAKTCENVEKCWKTSTRFGTFFVVFERFCAFSFVFERFCTFLDVLGRGFWSFVIYILVTSENVKKRRIASTKTSFNLKKIIYSTVCEVVEVQKRAWSLGPGIHLSWDPHGLVVSSEPTYDTTHLGGSSRDPPRWGSGTVNPPCRRKRL